MLVASLLSAALVLDDVLEVVRTALSEIPAQSRLAELVRDVLAWYGQDSDDWERARDRLEQKYGQLDKVHTINNRRRLLALLREGRFRQDDLRR
jgi:hypothetical protein